MYEVTNLHRNSEVWRGMSCPERLHRVGDACRIQDGWGVARRSQWTGQALSCGLVLEAAAQRRDRGRRVCEWWSDLVLVAPGHHRQPLREVAGTRAGVSTRLGWRAEAVGSLQPLSSRGRQQ